MMDPIPNLWPEGISVKVVTPLAILRAQVAPLERSTQGLLSVQVSTTTSEDSDVVSHDLELVARSLGNLRIGILTVVHDKIRVYPAELKGELVEHETSDYDIYDWPRAASEGDFLFQLGKVLKSKEVRSIIDSLLARMNEQGVPANSNA